jgi:hypothetical protein
MRRIRSFVCRATFVAMLFMAASSQSSYAQDGYDNDYADYQDYAGDYGQEDNLYYDYAQRQESKK